MATIRNNTFAGAPASDVDVDQLTFKRVISNAIGDTALVEDILTGEHSPPADSTIDHTGLDGDLYRGCPLGMPLSQVVWPSNGGLLQGPSLAHGDGTDVFIAVIPFEMPVGETHIDVDVYTGNRVPLSVQVRSLAGTLIVEGVLANVDGAWRGRLPVPAGHRWLAIRKQTPSPPGSAQAFGHEELELGGIFIGFVRQTTEPTLSPPASPSHVFTVPHATSSGAEVMSLTRFDEVFIDDARAISAYHLSRLNQTQNALEEYLTGAPAVTNAALSLEDSGATNPTQSAFHDHSQGGKANEPLADCIPLWAEPWGGIQADGTLADFAATWEPSGLLADATETVVFANALTYIPDGPADEAGSKLWVMLIACSPTDEALDIEGQVECFTSGGSGAGAYTNEFEQIGATRFWYCLMAGIPYHPDTLNRMEVSVTALTGTASPDGFRMLGGCAFLKVF